MVLFINILGFLISLRHSHKFNICKGYVIQFFLQSGYKMHFSNLILLNFTSKPKLLPSKPHVVTLWCPLDVRNIIRVNCYKIFSRNKYPVAEPLSTKKLRILTTAFFICTVVLIF